MKSRDFSEVLRGCVIGQRTREKFYHIASRWMRLSRIARDAAVALLRADQPPEALLEGEKPLRAPGIRRRRCGHLPEERRARAATMGSLGTANGSLSMITQESCEPGTSTPCQKLEVAKRTAFAVERKRSSKMERGAVPCRSKRKFHATPPTRSKTSRIWK